MDAALAFCGSRILTGVTENELSRPEKILARLALMRVFVRHFTDPAAAGAGPDAPSPDVRRGFEIICEEDAVDQPA